MGFASDYVQVNERIEKFKEEWPEGSLQSEVVELTDSRVTVKAMAFRHPDDPRPGIGHSFMSIPGTTSFTRGSELENTETSAWGRALAALGYEVKKSVASAEEVANKKGDEADPKAAASKPKSATTTAEKQGGGLSDRQRALLMAKFRQVGLEGAQRVDFTGKVVSKYSSKQLNSDDLDKLLIALKDEALVEQSKAEVKA